MVFLLTLSVFLPEIATASWQGCAEIGQQAGGSVRVRRYSGTALLGDQTFTSAGSRYLSGSRMVLTATANYGWQFDGWYSAGRRVSTSATVNLPGVSGLSFGGNQCSLAAVIQARFSEIPIYNIIANVVPAGAGRVTGTGQHRQGTGVTLRAEPYSGWRFLYWQEGASIFSENASMNFPASVHWDSSNRVLSAVFESIAQPASVFVCVGGIRHPVSAYVIDGSTFARLRHLAVATRNTGQQFNNVYDSATSTIFLTGGVTADADAINITADFPSRILPFDTPFVIDGAPADIRPVRVDGAVYVPIGRFSELMGLSLTRDESINAFILTTFEIDAYIHTELPAVYIFEPPPAIELPFAHTPSDAGSYVRTTIQALSISQRVSADALNTVTLYIENVARRSTTQELPAGGVLSAEALSAGASLASDVHSEISYIIMDENVNLLRHLRSNINFVSDEIEQLHVTFPESVENIAFDNVTIEAPFAMVTINRDNIVPGGEVEILPHTIAVADDSMYGQQAHAATPVFYERASLSIMDFWWSIVAVLLIIGAALVLHIYDKRLRVWVVPAFCAAVVLANILVVFPLDQHAVDTAPPGLRQEMVSEGFEIYITEGMRAIVSLPFEGDSDSLVVFNRAGEPQLTRYNPVSNTIEVRIRESGVYTIAEHTVSFADIHDKSQLMQDAILRLASRGILQGTVDGYFNPDDPISRADFVSAIIMAFDLLDLNAYPTFTDIDSTSWYHRAIATAEQEGIISGFPDGTFRGHLNIPKDQLTVVSANTLVEHMGYIVPENIEDFLQMFVDREELASWAEGGIALATQASVTIHRADSRFAPQSSMTRGDAAIVLDRVFGRIW